MDCRMKCTSYVAMPYPMATIPPMSGEISMAPMMTATLFMFRPTQAIMMAMTRTMRFVPDTVASARMRWLISWMEAAPPFRLNRSRHIIFSHHLSQERLRLIVLLVE